MSEVGEKNRNEEEGIWYHLPEDLVSLIKSRLFAGDYRAFNAMCRSWRSATLVRPLPPPINCPFRSSPCLMSIRNDIVKVFHPVYDDFYCMNIPELYGANILSSKYGWLLVSVHSTIFFFNPFTREKMALPDIPFEKNGFICAAFTSPPTSHDCLVIGALGIGSTEIALLRRGRRSWDTYEYENIDEFKFFLCSDCNPVLFNGLCYVLTASGAVGVFDPNNPSWKVIVEPFELDFQYSLRYTFFLELDGKLVGVFVSRDYKVHIFSVDFTNNVWRREQITGGDNALYASCGSTFSRRAVVNGMSNKIYFPAFRGNNGVFYSLSTNIFRSFAGDSSTADKMIRVIRSSAWIEPTFGKACDEEQLIW